MERIDKSGKLTEFGRDFLFRPHDGYAARFNSRERLRAARSRSAESRAGTALRLSLSSPE